MFISSVACTGFLCFSKWFLFYFLIRKSCFALTLIFFLCTAFFFLSLICWQAMMDGELGSRWQLWINYNKKNNLHTHEAVSFFVVMNQSLNTVSAALHLCLWRLHSSRGCIALCSIHASMLYATQNSVETELNCRTWTDGPSGRLYTVNLPVLI